MSKHDKALDRQASADISWLVRSVTRMARPIVRLCVGRMSCNAFINVVKRVYVEEATRHLERENPGKKVTKSALALLSGLDSRAVDSIFHESNEQITAAEVRAEVAILETWAKNEMFQDPESKQPKILPIYGKGLTFQTLVSRVAGRNVTCPTVLDKLIYSKNVRIVDDTFVQLLDRVYLPFGAYEREMFETGSVAIGRLAGSVSHNLEVDEKSEKWLQQERWSARIPPEKLDVLRSEIRTLINEHIMSAEELLDSYEDPVKTSAHCSTGVGWFYWESRPDE